jgi:hypothetical protein
MSPGIRSFVADNVSRPCSARHCTKRRNSASRYCASHDQRIRLYRDERGGAVPQKLMQKYTRLAHFHVKQWKDTSPLFDALLDLHDLLTPGGEPEKYTSKYGRAAYKGSRPTNPRWWLWRQLTTLAEPERAAQRQGNPSSSNLRGKSLPRHRPAPAAPIEAMEAVLAVWLADEIGRCYRNDEAVTLALGRAVLSLRSQPVVRSYIDKDTLKPVQQRRKVSSVALKVMGQMIRDRLGVALMMATEQVKKDDQRRADRREKARKPYPVKPVKPTPVAQPSPARQQTGATLPSERQPAVVQPAEDRPTRPSFIDFLNRQQLTK